MIPLISNRHRIVVIPLPLRDPDNISGKKEERIYIYIRVAWERRFHRQRSIKKTGIIEPWQNFIEYQRGCAQRESRSCSTGVATWWWKHKNEGPASFEGLIINPRRWHDLWGGMTPIHQRPNVKGKTPGLLDFFIILSERSITGTRSATWLIMVKLCATFDSFFPSNEVNLTLRLVIAV